MCGARWPTTTISASRPTEARRPERKPRASLAQTPSGKIAGWWLFFRTGSPSQGVGKNAEGPSGRRQAEHLGGASLFLDHRPADAVHLLGGVFPLRARRAPRLGVRRDDHDVRDPFHDGGGVYPLAERPRARRRALRVFHPASAGVD